MKKATIIVLVAAIIMQLMPLIYAEPLLTGIFYDPEGVDTGFEWIELYNPTNESVDLANYALFKGNGDKENDWSALPQLSGIIYPYSFYLIGEANVSNADLTLKIALFNGPDALELKSSDNETVDLVGYGTQTFGEYVLGNPTVDVTSGKALSRKSALDNGTYFFSQTNNNSYDWQISNPNPRNNLYQYVAPLIQNTSATLVVPQLPTIIENITLSDDQPSRFGTQWSIAGKKRFEMRLRDESSTFNSSQLQVTLAKGGVNRALSLQILSIYNDSSTENVIIVEFTTQLISDLASGNYSLQIRLTDGASFIHSVELLPSIGLVVCDNVKFTRNDVGEYIGKCHIQNVGNVPAYVGLNLTFENNLIASPFARQNQTLMPLNNTALLLNAGEQADVEIVTNISRLIRFGEYKGTLQVRAWSTN